MDTKATFGKSSTSILIFKILTIVLLITMGCSSSDDTSTATTPDPPPDGGSTTEEASDQTLDRSLTSNYNSETYPLKIFLPAAFETNKNLPVIYLTHGFLIFETLKQKTKEIGLQAIIVAIGDKVDADTQRDFFPSFCGGRTNDGFENFYNLITQQLVPLVDENWENDHSARSLIGYAYGGVFAVSALLMENPEAVIFHGSIAIAPSFNCNLDNFNDIINEMDDRMASANSNESFKLYHANRTTSSEINDYMETKAMELPWFEFDFMDFENQDDSVVGPSLVAGLRYIY